MLIFVSGSRAFDIHFYYICILIFILPIYVGEMTIDIKTIETDYGEWFDE